MPRKTKAVLFNTKHIGESIRTSGLRVVMNSYESQLIVENVFNFIKRRISDGAEVNIAGFGKFYTKDVLEKQVRNPKTGEKTILPAHKKVKFKPGLRLKERINSK